MSTAFVVVPIVEGHGEVEAVPVLLRRVAGRLDPNRSVEVRRPIRVNRGTLVKQPELSRYVDLAGRMHGGLGATLVLVDADDDCAATMGPELQSWARAARPDVAVAVVLAVHEYEGWFLASASSIAGHRGLPADLAAPDEPESVRDAKGWLQRRRTDGLAYAPTVDQPALSARFDIDAARAMAPSFDKLCRELRRLMEATAS